MRNGGYDGKVHSRVARFIFFALLAISVPLVFVDWQFVGLAIGGLIGWFLTPDIDHKNMTHEDYRALRILGVFGGAWVGYWTLYSLMFRHRSLASHSLFGTLTRAVYLALPPLTAIYLIFGWTPPLKLMLYLSTLSGWMIQDAAHLKADGLGWTGWNR